MFGFSAVNNQSNGTFGLSHVTGIVSDYPLTYVNCSSFQGVIVVAAGDVYPFDKVLQGNLNGNYDTSTFTYTVNVQGRYLINVLITKSAASGSGGAGICINNILALICGTDLQGSSSTTYVTDLMPGDQINIQQFGIPHTVDMSDNYCMFSVDLL